MLQIPSTEKAEIVCSIFVALSLILVVPHIPILVYLYSPPFTVSGEVDMGA
jgi:hypothetical protein